MKLKKLVEQIKEACTDCKECDPCCTWNLLKKCIENERVVLGRARQYASVFQAEV